MQTPRPTSTQDSLTAIAKAQLHLDSLQIATLRTEVAVLRDTRSDVLGATNTALTVILGLAALLIGFNWFSTNRSYRRDRETIQKGFNADLSARVDEISESARAQIADAMNQATEAMRVAVASQVSTAVEDTRQKLAAALAEVRGLRSEILDLRIAAKHSDIRYWELREVPGNEIDRWVDLLNLLVANRREGHELTETLSNITRLGRTGVFPYWAFIPQIVAQLDKLPTQYQTEVAEIKTLFQKVPRG